MCTVLYFWLASKLGCWEDEPFTSCMGLCLFVVSDIYLISHFIHEMMI